MIPKEYQSVDEEPTLHKAPGLGDHRVRPQDRGGMMNKSIRIGAMTLATITVVPAVASAQIWDPLGTVPKPNLIIGHDTSVTMGIDDGCNNCHTPGNSRLETSKTDILATLPSFGPYFNYGQFEYQGCGEARITERVIPRPDDPTVLPEILGNISSARTCGSKEHRLPGGNGTTCITNTCGMSDAAKYLQLARRALPGFDPLAPFRHNGCAYTYVADYLPCVAGATPMLDTVGFDGSCIHIADTAIPPTVCDFNSLLANFAARFAAFQWPRWEDTGLNPGQVNRDFCQPMDTLLTDIRNDIEACFGGDPPMVPRSTFNAELAGACSNPAIANSACTPGSPFFNTCVCDQSLPGCVTGGTGVPGCTALNFKARQQLAVCETRRPGPGTFREFFGTQPDNVVNGVTQCRENAVAIFTDGYMGHTGGTALEANLARSSIYGSSNPIGNMAVFRVANSFTGHADAMMSAFTAGNVSSAYVATNRVNMQSSFAALLNRMYQGNYTGASMTMDSYGTVAVIPAFTVPGYRGGAQPTDSYTGWPMRLSMHTVDPVSGVVNTTPDWETDWAGPGGLDKARPAAVCYNEIYPGPTPAATIRANRGPGILSGANFPNGVARTQIVTPGNMDRDNVQANGGENIQSIRLGRMYGTARTKPVIVERAASDIAGQKSTQYLNHLAAISGRPRMIYTMGGGYVYGIHGGDPAGAASGNYAKAFAYDHTVADAGREVLRYAPSFVDAPGNGTYDLALNPMVQQPLTTGQLTAREIYIDFPAGSPQFRTVLVGSQGTAGRGMFALDVTNPCAPQVISEWMVPAGSASNEPMIYNFPVNGPGMEFQRPVVIVTDGLNGAGNIYAYDIATGAQVASASLPGGTDYPSEPVCVDVMGSGFVTHCYAVGRNGTLARVDIDASTYNFTNPRNITPGGVNTSLVFSTRPAIFFGPDGAVNVFYGSGDYETLTTPAGGNQVYKAIDRDSRLSSISNNPADLATACGGSSGTIDIGTARVLSPPIVRKGLVAFTTYVPGSSGCSAGQANLYAMNYASCADAITGAATPTPNGIGNGIPTSPELHEGSNTIVASTSAGVMAAQATSISNVATKGGLRPFVKTLYWTPVMPNP